KGYKVVYTPYAETPAECVATFGRLARQRMRWAEGHSYNVNKWFLTILRSPRLSLLEKAEFIYYGLYYLQSALFMLGSAAWLVSACLHRRTHPRPHDPGHRRGDRANGARGQRLLPAQPGRHLHDGR